MSTIVLPVLIYILEIVKYCIGNKLFFEGKIKGIKTIILSWIIYSIVVVLCDLSIKDMCLISYIAAGIAVYFIFSEQWKVKIFRILSILAITICMDELVGIFLTFIPDEVIITEIEATIESMITIVIYFLFIIVKNKCRLFNSKENNLSEIKKIIIIMCLIINLSITVSLLLYVQKYIIDRKVKLFCNIFTFLSNVCYDNSCYIYTFHEICK